MADYRDALAHMDQQGKNFSKIPEDNEPLQTGSELKELRRACLQNYAICMNKKKFFKESEENLTHALEIERTTKVLY